MMAPPTRLAFMMTPALPPGLHKLSAKGDSSDLPAAVGIHHAEEVSLGVGEHHEASALRIHPIHALSAKPDEPFDLGPLLLFAAHVQVEMGHVGLVQQERRAFATWRHQHALMAVGPAHITQGVTP